MDDDWIKKILNALGNSVVIEDARSRALVENIAQVARTDHPVLFVGSTGSGKEIAATLLHKLSERSSEPFVVVNCGAISEKLFEAAFFGHVKGAFAGAIRDADGYLAAADGGTLFLDELGDLPLAHQVALLRVLEGHPYHPVGSSRVRVANVRFVAATNRDLPAMIQEKSFREDLYARLQYFVLRVPPLCERPADVAALARRLAETERPDDPHFAEQVVDAAQRLHNQAGAWPCGIRDLQALVARAQCFGVDAAEEQMCIEWQRKGTGTYDDIACVVAPAQRGHDERDALAGLIQAKLEMQKQGERGRRMALANADTARTLAELLLDRHNVSYDDIQDQLGMSRRATLENNLRPLSDSGLIRDDGETVSLFWPPVVVRFLQRCGRDWVTVPPGAIPCARTGERFCIVVTSQLPINARFYLTTHDGAKTEPRQLVDKKFVASGQKKQLEFELAGSGGFEQILVHLSWPSTRSIRMIETEPFALEMPSPQALHKERVAVLKEVGPGWLMEYLIQHVCDPLPVPHEPKDPPPAAGMLLSASP